MNRNMLFIVAGLLVAVSGCTLAPDYNRPAAPVPDRWPGGPAYATTQPASAPADTALPPRKQFFRDSKLLRVVDLSLRNNRDLRLASLNVERARAMYGVQRAELFPIVNAIANGGQQRLPADLSGTGSPLTVKQYGASLALSAWEIDFFGRIRSLSEAAQQQYFATEQARQDTHILLVSSVANAYLTLAADREALTLARTTLQTQQEAYALVKRRLDEGVIPELDLYRSQTQVDLARADLARFTQAVAQDENALDLLAGSPVPKALLPDELGAVAPFQEIAPGLSSQVLLRRPDILQAEALLKAAYANIGAARAALFPRIKLTSSLGTGSNQLNGLFAAGSTAWSVAPEVVMPIFDARAWAALRVTQVDKRLAVVQYERAIQTAFREVADSLAVRGTIDRQIDAQESLVHAADQTYKLSNGRYLKGLDSYLSVLDAQQALYAAQQGLVRLRLARMANQVRLFSVLGGGWDDAAEEPPPPKAAPAQAKH